MSYVANDADHFNALLYGEPHPGTMKYLTNQFSVITNTVSDATRNLLNQARTRFEWFQSGDAFKYARNVIKSTTSTYYDVIKPLSNVSDIQNAGLVMQRWVMANPVVRQRWQAQRCDGYSETYHDVQAGAIGEDHYDYRRVMSGAVVVTDDDWFVCQYNDDLKDGDRELTPDEQFDILHTWDAMDVLLAMGGDDPTSKDQGKL